MYLGFEDLGSGGMGFEDMEFGFSCQIRLTGCWNLFGTASCVLSYSAHALYMLVFFICIILLLWCKLEVRRSKE